MIKGLRLEYSIAIREFKKKIPVKYINITEKYGYQKQIVDKTFTNQKLNRDGDRV